MKIVPWRLAPVLGLALLLCLLFGDRGDALVLLQPDRSAAGSVEDLVFRVTNDRPEAFTKKVQIVFPSSPSFVSAQASAPSGWSSSVDELTGTVSSITFQSGSLVANNGADFVVTVTVPINSDRVVFVVLQTYSDGQVVRWARDPATGSGDGAVAPVLSVDGAVTTTTTSNPSTTTTTVPSNKKSDGTSVLTPGRGLMAFGAAILFTLVLRQRRINRSKK